MKSDDYAETMFGRPIRIPGTHGYTAFSPAPIPRHLDLPGSVIRMLADAEGALGQLAGAGRLLPNPSLLITPYVLREALSSSRIEGTQASMVEVLESDVTSRPPSEDVQEVANYVHAMRSGIDRLEDLPLSTRLLREIHATLMDGVRGRERAPGEFRTSQNWIGPPGSTIETAPYVPPPPDLVSDLLSDWERFANEELEMPLLIQDALLHSQFETIHPFLDGNGRLGRLVIVFFLIANGKLPSPLLYVSSYFEANRDLYYAALQAMRERGDPIPWLELFLTAVATQAKDALSRAERIMDVRERYRTVASTVGSTNAQQIAEMLAVNPLITSGRVRREVEVTRPTALRLLKSFEELGILAPMSSGPRGEHQYLAREMMDAVYGDDDA